MKIESCGTQLSRLAVSNWVYYLLCRGRFVFPGKETYWQLFGYLMRLRSFNGVINKECKI